MASLGEITIPVNFEITNTSKQVLKALIGEVIHDALTGSGEVFPGKDELIYFITNQIKTEVEVELGKAMRMRDIDVSS